MPTIRPASMTSRKTIKSVASILLRSLALLCDEGTLGLILVKIVEEEIGTGLQRSDIETNLAASGDDLLSFKVVAFEFGRSCVEILDGELQALVGGDGQLLRREFVLFQPELEGLIAGALRGEARHKRGGENGEWNQVTHAGNLLAIDAFNRRAFGLAAVAQRGMDRGSSRAITSRAQAGDCVPSSTMPQPPARLGRGANNSSHSSCSSKGRSRHKIHNLRSRRRTRARILGGQILDGQIPGCLQSD